MNTNGCFNYEREIDLIDALGYIISKWRILCIIVLAGVMLGCITSTTLGFVNMKKTDVEAQKMSAQKAEALALEDLLQNEKGEELKENAERNLVNYIGIQSMYDMQEEYNEKSLLNNFNANHITRAVLTYYIDNHYVNEYPVVNSYNNIADITGSYVTALRSDDVCNEIISFLGIDTEPKYIKEIVSVWSSSTSNICISITTDDEVMSGTIAEFYKELMPSITERIIANYGDVTVSMQDEQYYTQSDMDVLTQQNESDRKLLDYYTKLQKCEQSMSGAQKDYFDAILAEHNLETIEVDAQQHGLFYYISKKLIVLIAIGVVFAACVIFGVIYLFDGTIKTSEELALMSRSTLLGTVLVDNRKKHKKILLDKWAMSLTDARAMCDDSEGMVKTISASIWQYLSSNGINKVLFAGTDIAHMEIVDTIRDSVTSEGFKVNIAVDAFDSADSINMINESDVVVLVGDIAKSKCKKIERVLSLCNLYKKSIMGTVCIRERI